MVDAWLWVYRRYRMKIGVIGANGNLGNKIVKQAIDRGYDVQAFVYQGNCLDARVPQTDINLFDMTQEDVKDIDVLISAFGGGFHNDPVINRQAFIKYRELLQNSPKKLIAIAGAGSLYTDVSHQQFEYESPHHPLKLKKISEYIRLGVDELKEEESFAWTVVCPSRQFDFNGPFTGQYIVGQKEEIIVNDDHESYVTYEDLAKAMLDCVETIKYNHQVITIATKTKEG